MIDSCPWLEPYKFKKGHIGYGKGIPRSEEVKRKLSEKNTKYKIPKEELENLYYKKNLTLRKIAKLFGVSYTAIYERILKYKIKVRGYEFHKMKKATKKQLETLKLGRCKGKKCSEETRQKRRENRLKQVIPNKDTYPEVLVQKILEKNNIKFETHKPIFGQPDIFIEPNICIFVDGCYWHGCFYCFQDRNKLGNKQRYQMTKDLIIAQYLINQGYKVFRLWEHEIKTLNEEEIINKIVIKNEM